MILKTRLGGETYVFDSLKEVMAKANEEKSGDQLAKIAARTQKERVAAKLVLSQVLLNDLFNYPAVDYEKDEVTRTIIDQVNMQVFQKIANWTVADLREWLLAEETTNKKIQFVATGLTSEMIAAVTKLMSNLDLITVASKIIIEKTANTTIGRAGTFSSRLQPNHPTDDWQGILASMKEGLSMGAGDAVIGLNPVADTPEHVANLIHRFEEFRNEWEIPTQVCVLAHITSQIAAMRSGVSAGLIFQSIAGSEKGNQAFGIDCDLIEEARLLALDHKNVKGPNVMYFETGQGSELSSNAHFDTDQVTMEARCYGLAKKYDPFIVNTVVGFIGPEYLYDGKQVIRAGLEDHFMGKLTGLSMGCDVCYTNHMAADQGDAENLALLLANAGCNYIMGVPHADDVMLSYQSTGYQETATIRAITKKKPVAEFDSWLHKMGFIKSGHLTSLAGDASAFNDQKKEKMNHKIYEMRNSK